MDLTCTPLLALDPQPSLLIGPDALAWQLNPALQALIQGGPPLTHWLPANHAALVRACLSQARAISDVEAEVGERILLWTFIPDAPRQQVLARCRDASAERHGEREASRARRLYRLITENTTDLISRHSPDGRFLDATPAAFRLLGVWPEQLRASPAHGLLHPRERRQVLLQAGAALEADGYHTVTCRVRHADGRYRWFEIACRAIRETYTGAVVEIVAVSRDITLRIEAQESLAHSARVATLGELASGIAHEINQPLAAVLNYSNASLRYLNNLDHDPQARERVAQGLQRINAQATHAAQVIRRLRAFLRKGPRQLQAVDINEVAEEALRLCAWEAAGAQVRIELRLAAQLPRVYADRVLLEQVLLNLLRNAIDANREQHPGRPSRILLSARREADGLQVEVADQGPGVSPERMDTLFTPFITSKADGLGLGLSMSRSIVEGFDGSLWARAGEEHGLVLCCRLAVNRT
ncbi:MULTISPECIES: ATP-binding protein [unclassified Pseudomonas]|uniref:sensor histidine kinase n=1 Tax=unclassified Pseudomonas TaxID=196821 RepID=UPI00244D10CA|nr:MULTISPECIES: ATP-binding protein [unclassified Pseudomonas]MDH0300768.1 ATP-binding protein [Pseudomonas sp. GD04091]MDH1985020.1 ATP-binding protein [Pseudomonas sp. GD03689]